MIARISIALALAVTTLVGIGPTPAHAHENACAGLGIMHTFGVQVTAPPFGPVQTFDFMIAFDVGACVAGEETFSGRMSGWCGLATGTGSSSTGHTFQIDWAGTELTLHPNPLLPSLNGTVVGNLKTLSNLTQGDDCVAGASTFVVVGGVTLPEHIL
jgi:hypothetical protein